jgi:hypothetical protein
MHAERALWQLATSAEALTPQWLRAALLNRVTAIATCYAVPSWESTGDWLSASNGPVRSQGGRPAAGRSAVHRRFP